MKKFNLKHLLCSLAAATMLLTAQAAEGNTPAPGSPYSIIPLPTNIVEAQGSFTLPSEGVKVHIQGATTTALAQYIEASALQGTAQKSSSKADIAISISKKFGRQLDAEGYTMTVGAKRITINAATEAGAFYAVQTLLQLTQQGSVRTIDCCTITDTPRFPYRGLHFDVSRHFFTKQFLLKQIDAMALVKLNRMHLHLTDAAGWRLQIDRYPKLTSLAAWRPANTWQQWCDGGNQYCEQSDPRACGGFYTKDDIREILAYAAARHITVIPEIEMPGHSEETLAAYPEVSCDGSGKGSDFCPGKEATFQFLENVLTEVIDL
ncbi:MAG: beta-N-acetylhexosaminidase, partial [Muribaculaceae bacterium]